MNNRKAIWTVLVFELILASSAAVAQHGTPPSGSVAGEWNISFMVQGQTVPGTLVLAVEGETLTGTVETQHTGPGKLQDGKFASSKLSATCVFDRQEAIAGEWPLSFTVQGQTVPGTLVLAVEGETLTGTVETQ